MHHSTRARASACRMPPGWFRSRFSYFRSYEPVYSCLFIARKQLRTTSGNRTRIPRPYQSAVAGCAAAAPSSLSAVLRRLPPEPYNPGSMYSPTSFRWECSAVTPSKRVDDTSDAVRRHPTSSDWPDSNRRPPDPQSGALTKLRHNPSPAWGWIVRHPTPRREFPPLGVPEQAPERFHGGRTRNRTCRRPPDEPPTPSTNVGGAVGLTLQGRYPAFGGGVRRQHSHRVPSRVSRTPRDTPTPRERCGALCGLGGGRTRCLRVANATLYRLSYKPLASPRSHSPQGGCALSNPPPKGCGRAWRARPLNRSLRRTPSWEGGNRIRVWLTAVFPIQLPPRRPVPSSTHCSGFRTVRFDVSTPSANGA